MRLCNLKLIFCLITLQFGFLSFLDAQHYLFIEAEGRQPFYLKFGGAMLSSSAAGFIILSKIDKQDIDFIIGFPNKLYPEVGFKINKIQQDRGFLLKRVEGKGWVLVDRNNALITLGGPVDTRQSSMAISSVSSGFATLLAEATGDKSLLEKATLITMSEEKTASVSAKTKTAAVAKKTQPPKKSSLGVIRSYIELDDSLLKKIIYFDKGARDKWDTIEVEIDKTVEQPSTYQPKQLENIVPIASSQLTSSFETNLQNKTKLDAAVLGCVQPTALPKDIRELSRKISRLTDFKEQLAIATKAFSEKCFTVKQLSDLGALFEEEQMRLDFFMQLRKYISDPSLFGALEQSFLQESSKKVFREMLKQQPL